MLAGMTYTETLERQLTAIGARDLDGYLATVHDDAVLIMPNGRLLAGRDALADFHRDWFADPDWSWDLSPVYSMTAGDTGIAVLDVEYHDVDEAGDPVELRYLLSLTFARADGGWLMVHDQNTFHAA
jgi:uncharacterized protein (TIGR02246 family)